MALDGELWTGRDDFQNIVSIVRHKTPNPDDWKSIMFMIFDAPLIKGTFAERLVNIAEELAKKPNNVVKTIKQQTCKDKVHLEKLMDEICGGKGEGVMIKDPKSCYERKRSYALLKVKRFEDAEATIVGH